NSHRGNNSQNDKSDNKCKQAHGFSPLIIPVLITEMCPVKFHATGIQPNREGIRNQQFRIEISLDFTNAVMNLHTGAFFNRVALDSRKNVANDTARLNDTTSERHGDQ
ncbi:MAG TPA: hypothetical protein DFI00_08395, partial [Rhodospirillaceae bacterium]|nr:hypothetical protein [Rhodospirillaceae bacterium]